MQSVFFIVLYDDKFVPKMSISVLWYINLQILYLVS